MSRHRRSTTGTVLTGAALLGAVVGIASTVPTSQTRENVAPSVHTIAAATEPVRQDVVATTRDIAVASGLARRRPPQPGDEWGGCHDVRAAGSAPLYRGEPGYREDMDGDGDGIACEPPRV